MWATRESYIIFLPHLYEDQSLSVIDSMSERVQIDAKVDFYGAFWQPDDPSNVFTGRLARAGKFLVLTTSPEYKRKLDLPADFILTDKRETIEVLHGFTTEGPCSFLALQSTNRGGRTDFQSDQSLTFREYRVGLCVIGLLVPSPSSAFVSEAMFGYSGLHEWLPVRPERSRAGGRLTFSYPEKLPLLDFSDLASKTQFQLDVVPVFQHRRTGEMQSKHHSQWRVVPSSPQRIEWYLELAYRLENLFSLLMGTSIWLESVQLKHDETIGSVLSADRSKKQATDISVWVTCSGTQLAGAVSRWLSEPGEFASLEGLVYGTIRRSSLFVETEFLSLAQALESFHRVTTGTSMSFAARINELLAGISDDHRKELIGDDAKKFVSTLRDTRNHFTHVGGKKKASVLTGMSELFLFSQKLHALLRLVMLVHIGLPEDQVFDPIFQQSRKWS